MLRYLLALVVATIPLTIPSRAADPEEGFIKLWDGKTFNGWKLTTENASTFSIQDGAIVANGPRAHLFYVGDVNGGEFKNFELKVDVMTKPSSNGGIYFHTEYQEEGWPAKGFEVQVNNSHTDWRRSGGLYAVEDVQQAPAADGEWFTEHIIVQGDRVAVLVGPKLLVNWTQPEDWTPPEGMAGRVLGSGTFALQGHDPGSTVYYKNIRVKPLP